MIDGISRFLLGMIDGEAPRQHVEVEILTNAAQGLSARTPARKGILDVSSQTATGHQIPVALFGEGETP